MVSINLPAIVLETERTVLHELFHSEPSLGIVEKIWEIQQRIFVEIIRFRYSQRPTSSSFGCFVLRRDPPGVREFVPISAITGFALTAHRCIWDNTHAQRCVLVPATTSTGQSTFTVRHCIGNDVYILNKFRM